ncbi:MAG: efflux RND transporter periplasmic adaptor subunit [Pirellulales bacterium]
MKAISFQAAWLNHRRWWLLAAVLLVVVTGLAAAGRWFPEIKHLATSAFGASAEASHSEGEAAHEGEAPGAHAGEAPDAHAGEAPGAHGSEEGGHDHASDSPGEKVPDHKHDEAAAIKLSKPAQANIGLRLAQVELRAFERTMTVPGMVAERPGWSVLEVTAPMTGVVTKIYPIQGEAVQPGQPLFEVRLTHEDLLQVQTEFLRTIEELDVIGREVARLEKVSADGVIAGKTLLERKYEQQKQEAALRAQRQALLLHGLSSEQVEKIVATRTLLQSLTIHVPAREEPISSGDLVRHLQVQQLKVGQGKHVNAGDTLCTLVDHHELYIEGMAFEQDIRAINRAASAGRKVSAVFGSKSTQDEETVPELHILYLDDKVEQQSRAFHFYVVLPNRIARQDKTPDGRGFVYWQFKPGQRTQVRIPVEEWKDRIVLPVEAVAQDGAEAYVFEFNDDHFDRRPVHVEYRDQDWAVIANDGDLRVGATVAVSAAHQVQLALKNKSGGGVDPHAGHNH